MSLTLKHARKRLSPAKLPTPELTTCQRNVLGYMLRCWLQGWIPTMREIGDHMGIRSPNGVRGHLSALEKKGYLLCEPNCGFHFTDKALELAL